MKTHNAVRNTGSFTISCRLAGCVLVLGTLILVLGTLIYVGTKLADGGC